MDGIVKTLVSAIIPARNEEASIARAVESVAMQFEVGEVIVVNDQSTDRTGAILAELSTRIPKLRVIEAGPLPTGWIGKNHAASVGAAAAQGDWLLFTDADTYHYFGSTRRALSDAVDHDAVLVSYSPEQEMETWWERALIPFVYCRLAARFSFAQVNDPKRPEAAANGQFLLVLRDAYEAVGGHAAVAQEILEDVALARLVKRNGYGIYFTAPMGVVRTRMYRSFGAMWEGWTKNLYPLMGGNRQVALFRIHRGVSCGGSGTLDCGAAAFCRRQDFAIGGRCGSMCGRSAGTTPCVCRGAVQESLPDVLHPILFAGVCALHGGAGGVLVEKHEGNGRLEGQGLHGENAMIRVTRKIEFSAAHFYHNPNFSAEENRRVFGKCNNPHGHGHNYVLEVTVAGDPDPATGMVLDLKELKDILQREVGERMDHRHLNYEVPELAGQIPTCENIAAVIWRLLEPKITKGKLDRVRLYESADLFADCTAGSNGSGG